MSETKERELRECPLWQLVDKGKYLSEYAASIHWDRRKNTKEWMEGLHDAILDYQKMYASLMPSFNDECKMPAPAGVWTKEPNEHGLYITQCVYTLESGEVVKCDMRFANVVLWSDGKLYFVTRVNKIELEQMFHPNTWWLKINVPALPGEGGSE